GIPPYAAGHHQPLGGGGGSGGGGGGGSFSPLTMFECTISSATMLIDNMAVRDLLVAFKIVAQLHGHLLEVLDPTVQRLANVADEHALCPPPVTQSMSVASHLPGTSVGSAAVTIGNVGNSSSNSSTSKKLLDSSLATTAAYRVLKDETGTNVFDFSLPYSARANVLAANRVIDKALELSRHKPANVEAWRTLAVKYFRYYYAKNLKYPFRNVVKNVDTQRFIRRL
uniref:Exocyst subunit Exo70 family protein n=1 Tax=Macrostomum lignano TaxID=282301 RepID=A0A1I8HIC5_9PLAT